MARQFKFDNETIRRYNVEIESTIGSLVNLLDEQQKDVSALWFIFESDDVRENLNSINSISRDHETFLKTKMQETVRFLNEQITSYAVSQADLEAKIDSLIRKMGEFGETGSQLSSIY